MSKRPSLIAGLTDPAPAPAREPAAPPVYKKEKKDVQHTSIYVPREAFERLREIAFHERAKIHDLIMEGIDAVIERRGHPERTKTPKG